MSRPSKRIGDLLIGELVALEGGGQARITHAAPDDNGLVYPHRSGVPRVKVPAWYVIYRSQAGRDAGELVDPDDKVFLA